MFQLDTILFWGMANILLELKAPKLDTDTRHVLLALDRFRILYQPIETA